MQQLILPVALVAGYLYFRSRKGKAPMSSRGTPLPTSGGKPWHNQRATRAQERLVIADLDPRMRKGITGLLGDVRGAGHDVLLIYGRRGASLQESLADAGTGLRVGSKHLNGLAVDIVAADGWWQGQHADALWPVLGKFAKQRGFTWGGDWAGAKWDPAHVQWKG